jgi:hypothetical protein
MAWGFVVLAVSFVGGWVVGVLCGWDAAEAQMSQQLKPCQDEVYRLRDEVRRLKAELERIRVIEAD